MASSDSAKTQRPIHLIGIACGWGAPDVRSAEGPIYLAQNTLKDDWYTLLDLRGEADIDNPPQGREATKDLVLNMAKKTADICTSSITDGGLPVIIGGDHSVAFGSWSGVISALEAEENFGLIWIDAHMDAHTPDTAHQGKWGGNWHGMPLAHLLGKGDTDFINIASNKTKLNPKHVALVGIRSFEDAEAALLQGLGVRIFGMAEVKKRGIDTVLQEALAIATNGTKAFGVSLDLDAFDPSEAPAVATAEEDGLHAKDTLPALQKLLTHQDCRGLDIVEFIPEKDTDNKTASLIRRIIDLLA